MRKVLKAEIINLEKADMVMREIASVRIFKSPSMSRKGRVDLANWLHSIADELVTRPEEFADCFKARYICERKKT